MLRLPSQLNSGGAKGVFRKLKSLVVASCDPEDFRPAVYHAANLDNLPECRPDAGPARGHYPSVGSRKSIVGHLEIASVALAPGIQ